MLWMFVLPTQITFALMLSVMALATLLAPTVRMKRSTAWFATMLLAILAFIPSCMFISSIVNKVRFGVFEYSNLSQVREEHILNFMPPPATSIMIDFSSMGFAARYTINRDQLLDWVDEQWRKYGGDSVVARDEVEKDSAVNETYLNIFSKLGWTIPSDAIHYGSPRSGRHAGWEIWYSPSEGQVYEYANFW